MDFIKVKGKTKPVRIFEVFQIKENAQENLLNIKALFEKGLGLYRNKKWDEALFYFENCKEKYLDGPSSIFIERINHFKINPPPQKWDGVFEMKVK